MQKQVEIYLPDGLEMAGSHDVDALHYECKPDVNIWPGAMLICNRSTAAWNRFRPRCPLRHRHPAPATPGPTPAAGNFKP